MKYFIAMMFSMAFLNASAQNAVSIPPIDKSPMDMSYYPVDFPILRIQNKVTVPLIMRVIYSRPHLNGRKVFGGLQEYGEVWRLGANEATEIEFFRDVKINNQRIRKGRYTIYTIPYKDKWTFIINRETDTWGSFKYNAAKDVLRVNLPVYKNPVAENMTIVFTRSDKGADMVMCWDDVKTILPIQF